MSAPTRYLSWEGREELARLVALKQELVELETAIGKQVARARRRPADVSWADIGGALGMSAQGAQQKYRDVAPKVRNRRPTKLERLEGRS